MALSAAALVFVGGGLGAVARYGLVRASENALGTAFPYGVLAANIAGSFVMGVLAGWLVARGGGFGPFLDMAGHDAAKAALATGLLGGFTTFSAFSLDAVRLWEMGSHGAAIAYVGLSVFLALAALVVGLMLARVVLT
ncbi:MAG: CrcB family protein [Hyphomicrobiales bacterium]